jgi:hypothetical protein
MVLCKAVEQKNCCLHDMYDCSTPLPPPLFASCPAGVLILSKEFVRKQYPMQELQALVQRWRAGEVELVPVLYEERRDAHQPAEMTLRYLDDIRSKYDRDPWCVKEKKPGKAVLDEWEGTLKLLRGATFIRLDQVGHILRPWLIIIGMISEMSPPVCCH